VANAGRAGPAIRQKFSNGPFLNRIFDPKAVVVAAHWSDGRDYTLAYTENTTAWNYDTLAWNGFNKHPNDATKSPLDENIVGPGNDRLWSPVFSWHTEPEHPNYINSSITDCDPDCAGVIPPCDLQTGTGRLIGEYCNYPCVFQRAENARPSSEHSGGVNVAFASGRVLFLRETIDYGIFRALMTLSDKNSDSPKKDIVIDDQSIL
jgi:Protein of unknown function (DUF1559)